MIDGITDIDVRAWELALVGSRLCFVVHLGFRNDVLGVATLELANELGNGVAWIASGNATPRADYAEVENWIEYLFVVNDR